jgi:hypothetical protein
MSIISCPNCDKLISSHSSLCPYCGFQRGEVSEAQLKEFQRRQLRDRIYRLKMASYAALAMLLAAFGWLLLETGNLQHMPSNGPYLLFSIGSLCYLVIRIYLYKAKAALKKLGT